MKKITIGVPVYNAEPFLIRCLDSLLRQGVDSQYYEILCVDDGSTDASWNILCKYKKTYPEIFTIIKNEHNIGLAKTRNRLIENAKGEYLGFVDADDFVIDGSFAFLCSFLREDIDVLQFSMITLDDNVLKKNIAKTTGEGEIVFDGFAKTFLERCLPTFIQVLFIRIVYLYHHNLRVLDTRYCEDPLFILRLYMTNPRMRYVNADVYRYTVNCSQMSRERDALKMQVAVNSYMTFFEYLVSFRDNCSNSEKRLQMSLKNVIDGQLRPFISRTFCANISHKQFEEIRSTLKLWGVIPVTGGISSVVINLAFLSFYTFRPIAFLFKHIFVPYILPKLNRN